MIVMTVTLQELMRKNLRPLEVSPDLIFYQSGKKYQMHLLEKPASMAKLCEMLQGSGTHIFLYGYGLPAYVGARRSAAADFKRGKHFVSYIDGRTQDIVPKNRVMTIEDTANVVLQLNQTDRRIEVEPNGDLVEKEVTPVVAWYDDLPIIMRGLERACIEDLRAFGGVPQVHDVEKAAISQLMEKLTQYERRSPVPNKYTELKHYFKDNPPQVAWLQLVSASSLQRDEQLPLLTVPNRPN